MKLYFLIKFEFYKKHQNIISCIVTLSITVLQALLWEKLTYDKMVIKNLIKRRHEYQRNFHIKMIYKWSSQFTIKK